MPRFILPDFPATTKWLTAEEREYAVRRLEHDNNSTQAGTLSHLQSFVHAVQDWRLVANQHSETLHAAANLR